MKAIIFSLLFVGLSSLAYAQKEISNKIPEIEVYATNYEYAQKVYSDVAVVNHLETRAANFDISEIPKYFHGRVVNYQESDGTYVVHFSNSKGSIEAIYDRNGKILSTVERFQNIKVPLDVRKAIYEKYPNSTITKDVYMVRYRKDIDVIKKYKIRIEYDNLKKWVKIDDKGRFL